MAKLTTIIMITCLLVACSQAKSIQTPDKTSFNCESCKFFIGAIEDWIVTNETMTTIIYYVDYLCSILPRYAETCSELIQYGVPMIIEYIEKYENPETVCYQLGMCDIMCPDIVFVKCQTTCPKLITNK